MRVTLSGKNAQPGRTESRVRDAAAGPFIADSSEMAR